MLTCSFCTQTIWLVQLRTTKGDVSSCSTICPFRRCTRTSSVMPRIDALFTQGKPHLPCSNKTLSVSHCPDIAQQAYPITLSYGCTRFQTKEQDTQSAHGIGCSTLCCAMQLRAYFLSSEQEVPRLFCTEGTQDSVIRNNSIKM